MGTITLLCAGLGAIVALSGTAHAQNARSWVASNGGGAACTRAAPCANFAAAQAVTVLGGEIFCVDGAFYGGITTHSVTIDCTGTGARASFLATDAQIAFVTVRGLTFDGGRIGVNWTAGGELRIENCKFTRFFAAPLLPSDIDSAIFIAPPAGQIARAYISDTIVSDSEFASSGGGIIVQPQGTGSARVVVNHTVVKRNNYGIFANGTQSTGSISMHIRDSDVTDNFFAGISAFTNAAGAVTSVVVDHSSSTLNGTIGIWAEGANARVFLRDSIVAANATGLSATTGGRILSFRDNGLNGNLANALPTDLLSLQ